MRSAELPSLSAPGASRPPRHSAGDERCGCRCAGARVRVERAGEVVARREEHGGTRGVDQADPPQIARPVALPGEEHAAGDDPDRAEDQRQGERLVQEDERDRHCDERRRANRHRGTRRADLAHREREEDLRTARRKEAGEQKRPRAVEVEVERRRDQGHSERREDRRERRRACIGETAERQPQGHRHRTEERRRREREANCRQCSPRRSRRGRTSSVVATGRFKPIARLRPKGTCLGDCPLDMSQTAGRRRATVPGVDALDTLGRPLRDLRISVTDRCNFRCVYCMPKEVYGRDHRFLDRRELLSFEEIARVARHVRRGRRQEDPAHRRRAARAPRSRAADRAARRPRRRADADDERLAPARQGPGAGRRGPRPDHRQPRLPRRSRRSGR